jgi:PBP1b-binding outer membrane lipoprotein LpoB
MKIILVIAMMLLSGCVTTRAPETNAQRSTTSTPSSGTASSTNSGATAGPTTGTSVTDPNRDMSDCEREAALSSAGSKAQAFDRCMRARSNSGRR